MPVPLRLFGHCSLHNVKPARCRSCSCVFILPRAKPEAFEICFLSILSVCCRLAVAVVYGTKSWVLRREFCEMNEIVQLQFVVQRTLTQIEGSHFGEFIWFQVQKISSRVSRRGKDQFCSILVFICARRAHLYLSIQRTVVFFDELTLSTLWSLCQSVYLSLVTIYCRLLSATPLRRRNWTAVDALSLLSTCS